MTTTATHYLTMCKDSEGRIGLTCVGRKVVSVERECGIEIGDIILKIGDKVMEEDSGMVLDAFRESGNVFEITLARQVPSTITASFRESEAAKAHRLRERQIRYQQLSNSPLGSTYSSAWMTPQQVDTSLPWAPQTHSPSPSSPTPFGVSLQRNISPIRSRSPFETGRPVR
eukprot:TRINITY_DN7507_c0_g1_i1.p1 TRINITY_DN7507_c0_g1~~TRINITY_DN7507_c0_g1_i1.p1  ORF type:complete len:171 (+),score=28.61 TRINITY_DN7507_c0_g1_i1:104-616(+)